MTLGLALISAWSTETKTKLLDRELECTILNVNKSRTCLRKNNTKIKNTFSDILVQGLANIYIWQEKGTTLEFIKQLD